MQHLVKNKQPLLDSSGRLSEPGYALYPVFTYHRDQIKASKWRIKEWDYYACLCEKHGFSFTIADLGYSGLVSVVFLDFENKIQQKKSKLLWFPFGKLKLPNSSLSGDLSYQDKDMEVTFLRKQTHRELIIKVIDFYPGEELHATLRLLDKKDDSMVIATPWKNKPKAFYYNEKINCIPTSGEVSIGKKNYLFSPDTDFSVLDWGRGVWTYKNTWYWGNASGIVNGRRFGFNIGYGFGNTEQASENMLFYDGKAHKLDQIVFQFDSRDFLKPWKFLANDKRFEMEMEPLIDRQDDTNFGIIKNLGHQVFGRFRGQAILDDGSTLLVDHVLGFAEVITNHY